MRYYDRLNRCEYLIDLNGKEVPSEVVPLPDDHFFWGELSDDQILDFDSEGLPILLNKRAELSQEDKIQIEEYWVKYELQLTDIYILSDFPITEEQKKLILAYRNSLRNPQRESHPKFPDKAWRPLWPQGVKRPSGDLTPN